MSQSSSPASPEVSKIKEATVTVCIETSAFHREALQAVRNLGLPNVWIAAGFVRNYVWDCLHGYEAMTPLNDIDVIYYDPAKIDEDFEKEQEQKLEDLMPGQPWSVKNQARMHVKNGDGPYQSIEEALEHWCETVTPVGVRLEDDESIALLAPLGVDDLISLRCHATPFALSRPDKLRDYRQRMKEKKWWEIWPQVTVYDLD